MYFSARYKALLLKAWLIIFSLNTSLAYGVCCVDSNTMPSSHGEPPCHSTAMLDGMVKDINYETDDNTTNIQHGNTCIFCLAIAIPFKPIEQTIVAVNDMAPFELLPFHSQKIAPLYKPPIS